MRILEMVGIAREEREEAARKLEEEETLQHFKEARDRGTFSRKFWKLPEGQEPEFPSNY